METPAAAAPYKYATVVSAFYPISSKFPVERYLQWIQQFWPATCCPLVWFTTPEYAPLFVTMFQDRKGPTLIKTLPMSEFAAIRKLSPAIWGLARQKDPEQNVHHTPELYAIWYEKKEFVLRVIEENPFGTETFVWCDAGICRFPSWIPYIATRFPLDLMIPRGRLLLLEIDPFREGAAAAAADGIPGNFETRNTVGGGIQASDRTGWEAWSRAYDAMFMRYYLAGRFVGKDQNIMASVALEHPNLVHIVPSPKSVNSVERWFFLLPYLANCEIS